MRTAALVLIFAASLVACGEAGPGIVRHGKGDGADAVTGEGSRPHPPSSDPSSDPSASPSGAPAVCPADVAAPLQIASDVDATNLRMVGDAVYFQTGTSVMRIGKDGKARQKVYQSADLVRAFPDGTSLLTIETPDPPNASLKVISQSGSTFEVQTDLNAGGTYAFAADAPAPFADAAAQSLRTRRGATTPDAPRRSSPCATVGGRSRAPRQRTTTS